MELKARIFEVEQGANEVVLNADQAKEQDISIGDRIKLVIGGRKAIAIVDHSHNMIKHGEIGLFQETTDALKVKENQRIRADPVQRPQSLDFVKKKLDGGILSDDEVKQIINDLMEERLSTTELAAFISAVYTKGLTVEETIALTKAIYSSGGSLSFKNGPVVGMHGIGGVAGDRTSMLITPIIASLGVRIPKTCSRAISSASGTADAMEVLAPVTLTIKQMKEVVDKTNGCIVWGGSVNMAAADDKLIQIRKPLRLDPKALLLSSILAKKKAEGARYVLLDIPTGRGSKVLDLAAAHDLAKDFGALGTHLGMRVECTLTDGSEPLMEYIGPALEARAVLETLAGKGSESLREKACTLAGLMLSMIRDITRDEGYRLAKHQVESGKALEKFRQIIGAQGGNAKVTPEQVKIGKYSATIKAKEDSKIAHVSNVAVSRLCRSLGAPQDKEAGIILKAMKGKSVKEGEPLIELYASSKDKLVYGLQQYKQLELFEMEKVILDVV